MRSDAALSDVPESLELEPIDRDIDRLRCLVDDPLGGEIGLAGWLFAIEAGGPVIGGGFVFTTWVLLGATGTPFR